MRFMMIVKSAERSGLPPKPLMDAIGKLSEEATNAGTMVGGGGLGPTAPGPRPAFARGNQRDRRTFHRGQRGRRRVCAV